MTLPPQELAKWLYGATALRANFHIRELGRFNQRYPLLCRDDLRAAPLAAAAYATIKHELAARFPHDADSTSAIKDPDFDLIMAAANLWAKATNWTIPPTV